MLPLDDQLPVALVVRERGQVERPGRQQLLQRPGHPGGRALHRAGHVHAERRQQRGGSVLGGGQVRCRPASQHRRGLAWRSRRGLRLREVGGGPFDDQPGAVGEPQRSRLADPYPRPRRAPVADDDPGDRAASASTVKHCEDSTSAITALAAAR